MNNELVRYIACVAEQEKVLYKYKMIAAKLGIPRQIEEPYISNYIKEKKLSILGYLTRSALIFCMLSVVGMISAANFVASNIGQESPGYTGAMISSMCVALVIAIIVSVISLLIFLIKLAKIKKVYNKEKAKEDARNDMEIAKYTDELRSDEERVRRENIIKANVEKQIERNQKLLDNLYNIGIIYPKYRNFTAITMICEYLQSGRCETLSGTNGAYNLYEKELLGRTVIGRLDDIIASLEEIKDNQYLTYMAIKETNNTLNSVREELHTIGESATITKLNTEVIARETQVLAIIENAKDIDKY